MTEAKELQDTNALYHKHHGYIYVDPICLYIFISFGLNGSINGHFHHSKFAIAYDFLSFFFSFSLLQSVSTCVCGQKKHQIKLTTTKTTAKKTLDSKAIFCCRRSETTEKKNLPQIKLFCEFPFTVSL